ELCKIVGELSQKYEHRPFIFLKCIGMWEKIYSARNSLNIFSNYGVDDVIRIAKNEPVDNDLISKEYIPDLYTLSQLETGDEVAYKNTVDQWILGTLLRAEVVGYLKDYFENDNPESMSEIKTKIKYKIAQMNTETIRDVLLGRIDNPISSNKYKLPELYIADLSEEGIKSMFENLEVTYYIFESSGEDGEKVPVVREIEKQIEAYASIIREEALRLFTTPMGKGQKFCQMIGVAEAEVIVRQLAEVLLTGQLGQNKSEHNYFFAEMYKSKEANRLCYSTIDNIINKLNEQEESLKACKEIIVGLINCWGAISVFDSPGVKLTLELEKLWPGFVSDPSKRTQLKEIIKGDEILEHTVDELEKALSGIRPNVSTKDMEMLYERIRIFNRLYSLAVISALGNATDTSVPEQSAKFLENPVKAVQETHGFYLDAFTKFFREVVMAKTDKETFNLGYFTDNNGEIMFDLLFIRELLNSNLNPKLRITIIPKRVHVGNDVTYSMLLDILSPKFDVKDYFSAIRPGNPDSKVIIAKDGPYLQGVDFRDKRLYDTVNLMDTVLFKGQGNFKTSQGLKKPRYYVFMVKSLAVEIATGLFGPKGNDKTTMGPLIFCYIDSGIKVGIGPADLTEKVVIPNAEQMGRSGDPGYTAFRTLWQYYLDNRDYY
ncbi:MAG: ARMT1-like domain-containing protein, partial [Candidatus Omnitrophica bacterium]|nr:ARMT1-like domain-containing protein [Candidatus Omnitrophota bacterium]